MNAHHAIKQGTMEQHDRCLNIQEMNNMQGAENERSTDQSIQSIKASIRPKQDKPSNGFKRPQGATVQPQRCYNILMSSD